MTRHIVLGNQRLLVNIDQWLQVRDLYFPHVGQFNHLTGHAHRFALIEEGHVSWLNGPEWVRTLGYASDVLIGDSLAENKARHLSVRFADAVLTTDTLVRALTITNHAPHARRIRLAAHHDFHLYADGIGDTAFYSPEADCVMHYKRQAYFLIGLCDDAGRSLLTDYGIGEHVDVGPALTRNPIAQGSVDSALASDIIVPADGSITVCYYLCAAKTLEKAYGAQTAFLKRGYVRSLKDAAREHKSFLKHSTADLRGLPKTVQDLYRRSLLVIRSQMDHGGAITAANDSDNMQFNRDTYSYVWPRDGALVSIALIRAGFAHLTRPFFTFCRDVLSADGCLLHKYNPDRTLGSSWHPWIYDGMHSVPIQEDSTALTIHALWKYYEATGDADFVRDLYPPFIKPAGDFLRRYRYGNGLPMESYDLWEERRGILTFTTATVLAGLVAAERLMHVYNGEPLCENCEEVHSRTKDAMIEFLFSAEHDRFRRAASFEHGKMRFDDTLDASVYAVAEFGVFRDDDPRVLSTMRQVRERLWVNTQIGGIARYENDYYHKISHDPGVPGNPWFICTLWYAKHLIRKAKERAELDEAKGLLLWAAEHALPTGLLPEQLHPHSGDAMSVTPLTWSHAEFVDSVALYAERAKMLK